MSKIFSNSIIYTIGRVLPQAFSFILLPVYTFYLTPSDYGIINSMTVFSSILILVFTLALDRGVLRLYYDFNDKYDKKKYLGTIFISIVLASSAFLILTFVFQNLISSIYISIDFYPYFFLTILTSYFQVFSILPLIILQLNDKPLKYISLTLLNFLASTIFILYFIFYSNRGAEGFLFGMLLGTIITTPFFLYIVFKQVIFKFEKQNLLRTFKFTLPMIPTLASAWFLNLSDRIFIERYFSLDDVALYSVGSKISAIIIMIFGAFSLAYSPYFFKNATNNNSNEIKIKLAQSNNFVAEIFIILSFILCLLSEELITLFFNKFYSNSLIVIEILIFHSVISVFLGLLNLMYYQVKATLSLMYIFIFGAFVNLLLNFVLIPSYSYIGASIATSISFLFMFFVQLYFSKKMFYLRFVWNKLMFLIFLFILSYVIFKFYLDISLVYSLLLKLIFTFFVIILFTKSKKINFFSLFNSLKNISK